MSWLLMANQSTASSSVTQESLTRRTREFALAGIRLVRALPKDYESSVIGRQLVRAATSVGANYRAACRGRTRREFVARLGIVIEEADECLYWLELLEAIQVGPENQRTAVKREANELVSIFVVTRCRTAKPAARRKIVTEPTSWPFNPSIPQSLHPSITAQATAASHNEMTPVPRSGPGTRAG